MKKTLLSPRIWDENWVESIGYRKQSVDGTTREESDFDKGTRSFLIAFNVQLACIVIMP